MSGKLYTYGLILILLVSTTGLTFAWHFCNTLNVVNTEACEMEDMSQNKVSSGCCEKYEAKVTISGYLPVCCDIEVVENKISEPQIKLSGYAYIENTREQFRLINNFLNNLRADENFTKTFKSITLEKTDTQKIEEYNVTFFEIKCQ